MNQHKFSFRLGILITLIVLMAGVFSVRLFDLQVQQATDFSGTPAGSFTYDTRITAARGEILDCNGNLLVGNRASFNLILVNGVLYSADRPNEQLRRLTNRATELGLEYTDHFPVTMTKPYEYTTDSYSGTWNSYFRQFLLELDWDSDISAPQLIRRLRDRYNIPDDWSEEEARRVISVRYELYLRYITNLPTYVFLEDVDAASLASLNDLNIPGLNVVTSTVRECYTDYAAHIIGRIGQMNSTEYEYYSEYGYAMDAYVGKDGLEQAFELELHGTDGLRRTTVSSDGTVLEEYYIVEPVAGNNVELSIDINHQKVAEDALEELILDLRENGVNGTERGKDAEGGAVVMMKVKTGEVIVSASYPTYDPEHYTDYMQAELAPLYNRALQGDYPPGSVFKMVTAIAAVNSGAIDRNFEVQDLGIYRRFADVGYTPRCMLYTTSGATHGVLNLMQAIAVSCNYYFYEIGYLTGISTIDATAKALGLGESTGIELPESVGHRANPETKKNLYSGDDSVWYDGDTISTAIGQSENRFTPLQLCSYTAALANRGTRYNATFLRRVISADYQTLLRENTPTIASQLAISDEAYAAYTEGMRLSVTSYSGTSHVAFGSYDIAVCAKTGTAEHGSGGSDNVSYVLFAPADDPEVAITIYVEKGGQAGNLGYIARTLLDAYYSEANATDIFPAENEAN